MTPKLATGYSVCTLAGSQALEPFSGAKSKKSRTGIPSVIENVSIDSNEGAFKPRSTRLRKSTEISRSSANSSWVMFRSLRNDRSLLPNNFRSVATLRVLRSSDSYDTEHYYGYFFLESPNTGDDLVGRVSALPSARRAMSSDAILPFREVLVDSVGSSEISPGTVSQAALDISGILLASSPDEHLLQAVGRGEKQALSLLFQRYGRSVMGVAWRILRNEAEAQDLRQDVFLYLHERAHLYNPEKGTAASWIMQITYHRAFDRRRFLNHRQGSGVVLFDEEQCLCSSVRPSTDSLDGRIILDRFRDQLTPDQQQTLDLHVFEGYSFREIAERSGQSIGNVRHHYYRALDQLRANIFSKKRD